jgi:recombination protein RecA
MDCVLGGGWAEGRVANLIGDKSAGKTLTAIESMANFAIKHPEGELFYTETESAFDHEFARRIGFPFERVKFRDDIRLIEEWADDIDSITKDRSADSPPGLYVLDSLDALSDAAEVERKLTDKTFGMNKQKKMSELFRKLISPMEKTNLGLLVISQVRSNIGIAFGNPFTRTGGKALDFYASQIVWLFPAGKIKRKIGNIERVVGVNTRAKCEKNKVGPAYRDCKYPILFNFGMDDLKANVDFLKEVGELSRIEMTDAQYKQFNARMVKMTNEEYREMAASTAKVAKEVWAEIEASFAVGRSKY